MILLPFLGILILIIGALCIAAPFIYYPSKMIVRLLQLLFRIFESTEERIKRRNKRLKLKSKSFTDTWEVEER